MYPSAFRKANPAFARFSWYTNSMIPTLSDALAALQAIPAAEGHLRLYRIEPLQLVPVADWLREALQGPRMVRHALAQVAYARRPAQGRPQRR